MWYVSAPLLMSHLEQKKRGGGEEEHGGLSFVPSAVSETRWALRYVRQEVCSKWLQVLRYCGCCDQRRRNAHNEPVQELQELLQRRRVKQGEAEVNGVEASYGQRLEWNSSCGECGND